MRWLVSFLAAFLVFSGKPVTGPGIGTAIYSIQQPVEQQTPGGATQPDRNLWIVNPFTACGWDADDRGTNGAGGGDLAPGATYSVSMCVVADWRSHLWSAIGTAERGAKFTVSLSVPELGFGAVSEPSADIDQHNAQAKICASGPDYDRTSPDLLSVADSNGGVGKVVTLTYSITNLGERRIRLPTLEAKFAADSNFFAVNFCPGGETVWPLNLNGAMKWGSYPGPVIWWVK